MRKFYVIICLMIAQLSIPTWMVYSHEQILNQGELVKFKTRPVDPYDIFRGKYVALSYLQNELPYDGEKLKRGQKIFISFTKDEKGFIVYGDVFLRRPKEGLYFQTKVQYVYTKSLYIDIPFDRFYMREDIALKAEQLYNRANRNAQQDTYVAVRILNGKALIDDLYIGGKPVLSYFNS